MTAGGTALEQLSDEQLLAELAARVKEYARRAEEAPALGRSAGWQERLTATESALMAIDLLRASQITSFELAAMFDI